MKGELRHTKQYLLPVRKPDSFDAYDIYPAFLLPPGLISEGLESLARKLAEEPVILIDGYQGVFYDRIRDRLDHHFKTNGKRVHWIPVEGLLRDKHEIDLMIAPFLGCDDPVFGKRATLELSDFYDPEKLSSVPFDEEADIQVVIGPGAALTGFNGPVIYIDLPKNELQFRARAGVVQNLGACHPGPSKEMYKRFYFVDWVVLNKHKKDLLPHIHALIDGQRPDAYTWISGNVLREGLSRMARHTFRVRPWFEPGAWGGNWISNHIPGLNTDVPNYAWSFELITPENGLIMESSGVLLEISFDFLMYQESNSVLGMHSPVFGDEFPIRFDFLDTFNGGNLSVQCHPRPAYIKEHFGEEITQEETYYILDADEGAICYLGFQEGIDSKAFEAALKESATSGIEVDIPKYVMVHDAHKHDLFLIPPGTIHSSGKGNLVLEISATPYIFTFKMYDWLRLDLDGKPRPLNIDRGMDNLYFDRAGPWVTEHLISKPEILEKGGNYVIEHLPTPPQHSYALRRYRFRNRLHSETQGKCHVMSLVEGKSIRLETGQGNPVHFHYAETFVVPAATDHYTLVNESGVEAIVVQAFMKPIDHLKKTLPGEDVT